MKKRNRDEVSDYVKATIKKKGVLHSVKKKSKLAKKVTQQSPVVKYGGKGFLKAKRSQYQLVLDELSSKPIEELPKLPERLRDFAFRYATEHRTRNEWARIFHVSVYTVDRWRKNPHVMQYYLIIRSQRQALMFERLSSLEKKAYERLSDILNMPLSSSNVDVIRRAILDVLSITQSGRLPKSDSETSGGSVNVNIMNQPGSTMEIKTSDLKDKLSELELIEDAINENDEK